MKITTLAINVSGGKGNRAVVMDVFSFVDVFFIIDPPVDESGGLIGCEDGNFDLFSFVIGSGVECYVRSSVVGMFSVIEHDVGGVSVGYQDGDVEKVLRGVYVRPARGREVWAEHCIGWDGCDVLFGDFNARHASWDPNLTYYHGYGNWMREWADNNGYQVHQPRFPTFKGSSFIDLVISKGRVKFCYDDKAGLEHAGILVRISVDEPVNLVRKRPAWKRIDGEKLDISLRDLSNSHDEDIWSGVRDIVDGLPRARVGRVECRYWSVELERMRRDIGTVEAAEDLGCCCDR